MRWFKRILIVLASFIASCGLLVVGAYVFLNEVHYKQILSWGAEHLLDSELVIDGPIDVDISRNIVLKTNGLSMIAHDQSYAVSIGLIQGSFRLGSFLRTGAFWLNSIDLEDVTIDVMQSDNDDEFDFDLDSLSIPPLIIGRASVNKLVFSYQELLPGTRHVFSLDELIIDELSEQKQVSLRAKGLFEGQPYELMGSTDSIAALLKNNAPQNLKIELNSSFINANIIGTIDDPIGGHGMNLHIQSEISEIKNVLEIFFDEVPQLGEISLQANLIGDYDAPQLDYIDLNLNEAENEAFNITGSIQDIFEMNGVDLKIKGDLSNSEILSWITQDKLSEMQHLQISGSIQKKSQEYRFEEIDATLKTAKGLVVGFNGSAELLKEEHRIIRQDANLNIHLFAPTVKAADILKLELIPEMGEVSASFSLAIGMDAVGIYNCDINLGSRKNNQIALKGDVGYVQFKNELNFPDLRMQANIFTKNLANLHELLDLTDSVLPSIGPVHLQGNLISHGSELQLHDAILDAGTKDKAYMHATGGLAFQLHDPSRYSITMYVEVDAQKFEQLGEPFEIELPDFGKTRITGWLESNESQIEFKDARVDVGDANNPTLRANANVATDFHKGSDITVDFDVGIADLIAVYTDMSTGYLGRMHGDANISNIDGDWGLENFSFVSTQTTLFQWSLEGSYDDLFNYDQATINTNLVVKHPNKLGEAIGINLTNVGSFSKQGELTLTKKRLEYRGNMKLGDTTSVTNINGVYIDGKPTLEGSFEVPVMHMADFGFGAPREVSLAELEKNKNPSPYVFSRNEFDVNVLNKFDLDLDIVIDEVENAGQLEYDSINGNLSIKDGHLVLNPLHFVFEGGNTDIALDILAREVPEYKLFINADDVKTGPLMSQMQNEVPIQGYGNLKLDLSTQGRSVHEMVSALNGEFLIGLENVRIPEKYIALLSVDTFGWVLSKSGIGSHANLNCVVMAFDVNNGLVASRAIVADGPRLSIGGKIDLNLGDETLDIVLIPQQKKRIFSSTSPVKIHGPMQDPNVDAIPTRQALTQVAGFTLFAGVFVPVSIINSAWGVLSDGDDVGGGCENVREMGEKLKKKATSVQKKQDG